MLGEASLENLGLLSPSPLSNQLLEWGFFQKLVIVTTPNSRALAQRFFLEKSKGTKLIAPNLCPVALTSFARVYRSSNPTTLSGTLEVAVESN